MNKNTLRSFGILIGALGTAAYSCSPSAEPPPGLGFGATGNATGGTAAKGGTTSGGTTSGGTTSGGTTSGGTTSGGTTSGGTNSSGGSSGTIMVDVDAQPDAPQMLEDGGQCAADNLMATLKTVNMFVMYDRSWSMTECADGSNSSSAGGDPRCMTGDSRWKVTSEALKLFFQDPTAADLRVALRFFPDDNPAVGCDGYMTGGMFGGMMGGTAGAATGAAGGPNCDTNACSQPLVDIAPLTADPAPTDVQEQKLIDAITASAPPDVATLPNNAYTPTSAALSGAALWATNYQTAHPDEAVVIILITDGEPQGCDTNATNIANIAGTAFMTSGIQTYVIGLGGLNSATLDGIARAGGTTAAHTVSSGANSTADLLATLNGIKGMAITCAIPVPTADASGKKTDPNLVNVTYQSGPTGMPTTFPRVMSAADCGTNAAWYYDNNDAPTTISLCPSACTTATGDTMAQLSVALGCKQVVVTK